MATSLSSLPPEIILTIAKFLDYESEINALSQVNHRFHELLDDYLYKVDFRAEDHSSKTLLWATTHGGESAARKAIKAGARPGDVHLATAAAHGNDGLVTLFHDHGAKVNYWVDFADKTSPYHYQRVVPLLSYGADPMLGSRGHDTALILAAGEGHLSVVNVLLETAAAIDATDQMGHTALYSAAQAGHTDITSLLVSKGAAVNCLASPANGHPTPLAAAVGQGHIETVKWLLEHGAEPDPLIFYAAGPSNQPETLRILAQHSSYPRAAKTVVEQTMFAISAAACGLIDLLKETISMGWDVNSTSTHGVFWTALGWVSNHGHLDIVRLLLSHGAYPDGRPSFDGMLRYTSNPLLNAVQREHKEIVALLLEHGANTNVRDRDAEILHYAIPDPAIFKLLLDSGATPNRFDGLTLGMLATFAALEGEATEVEMLIDKGVDFLDPDIAHGDFSPIEIISMCDETVLNVFIDRGCVPHFGVNNDKDFEFALCAVRHGNLPLLRHLVSCGFDLKAMPHWPAALIRMAALARSYNVAEELISFLVEEQEMDINSMNENYETPLISIWQTTPPPLYTTPLILLQYDAEPCYTTATGHCALVAAVNMANVELEWVECLLVHMEVQDFEVVEPQLLEAISFLEARGKNAGVLQALRRCYWRLKYVVD
ncbi:ankyrin repeat-containing domain protein [Aspergillus germanicus]